MSEDKTTSDAAVKEQWDNASNKQKKVHHLQTEATFEMVSSIYDWMILEKKKFKELAGKRSLIIIVLLIGCTSLITSAITKCDHEKHNNAAIIAMSEAAKKSREKEKQLMFLISRGDKQKNELQEKLQKSDESNVKKDNLIKGLIESRDSDEMINEAYKSIALNLSPLHLQQYVAVATNEQLTQYTLMAVQRNAFNVIGVISEMPKLMQIDKVYELICDYKSANAEYHYCWLDND